MKIHIAIASRNFFGAERRILRIVHFLVTEYHERPVATMIVNSSLIVAARRTDWGSAYFADLDAAGILVVVPDKAGHLLHSRRLVQGVRALFGRAPLHAVLRAEPLAYFRALLKLPSSIEVTGPGSATDRARRLPLLVLKRLTAIRLLTPSVARTFRDGLLDRFGAQVAGQIMTHTRTASSPYFVPSATVIDMDRKENLIVSASRFESRKNVKAIAEAFAIALPQLPGWTARVMGQGAEDSDIREILQPLISEGRVFVGYESNVEDVFRRARIYISLIEPDNYPSQAVLEAMQFGNALILSKKGDSDKFITQPPNGALVPIDPEEVARQILALANDETRLRAMGEASIRHVREAFRPTAHIEELLAIHRTGQVE